MGVQNPEFYADLRKKFLKVYWKKFDPINCFF